MAEENKMTNIYTTNLKDKPKYSFLTPIDKMNTFSKAELNQQGDKLQAGWQRVRYYIKKLIEEE